MLSNSHRLKIVETQVPHSNKRKQHEADLTVGNSQRHETQARFPAPNCKQITPAEPNPLKEKQESKICITSMKSKRDDNLEHRERVQTKIYRVIVKCTNCRVLRNKLFNKHTEHTK